MYVQSFLKVRILRKLIVIAKCNTLLQNCHYRKPKSKSNTYTLVGWKENLPLHKLQHEKSTYIMNIHRCARSDGQGG